MNDILEKTPPKMGRFQFVEFEIHAEVITTDKLAILGSGEGAGVTGGLKFVFRRSPVGERESLT